MNHNTLPHQVLFSIILLATVRHVALAIERSCSDPAICDCVHLLLLASSVTLATCVEYACATGCDGLTAVYTLLMLSYGWSKDPYSDTAVWAVLTGCSFVWMYMFYPKSKKQ